MPMSCVLVKNNTNEFVDIKIVTESMAVWRFIIVCIITSNREQMKFYFIVKAQFINLLFLQSLIVTVTTRKYVTRY